jgi:hypothetical protein
MGDAAIVLGPDGGERLRDGFTIKADRGEISVTEMLYSPGQEGPSLHVRHTFRNAGEDVDPTQYDVWEE